MQFYDNWAIHYRMSSHHINAFKCIWRPMFIGLLSELLLARAGKIIPEDLCLFSFPAGGSAALSQHRVYIPKQGQLSKTSSTSPSVPSSSNLSFNSSQKTHSKYLYLRFTHPTQDVLRNKVRQVALRCKVEQTSCQ